MRNNKNNSNHATESQRFLVKTPVPGANDKVFWRTIGSAWLNPFTKDQDASISIRLDALPLGSTLQCYPVEETDEV